MILTHLVMFSFLNGAGGTVTTPIVTPPFYAGGGNGLGHYESQRELGELRRQHSDMRARERELRDEAIDARRTAMQRAKETARLETALHAERARSKRAAALRAEIRETEAETARLMAEAAEIDQAMTLLVNSVTLIEREIEAQQAAWRLRYNAALALLLLEG